MSKEKTLQRQPALDWLVPLIALLAAVAAGAGLFMRGGDGAFTFTTLHGATAEMYGRGLYQYDTLLIGAGFRGADAVTLLIAIPLLLVAYVSYRRGSLVGRVVMTAALTYFLYIGVSMALGAAFNSLFLCYTALFSASLFAVIVAMSTQDAEMLAKRVQPGFPYGGIAIFMFVAGLGTLMVWMSEVIGPLSNGQAPELLGPYTTMFTHAFDSAVITPAAIITGVFLLQRRAIGYQQAASILILCVLIGCVVIGQTISQTLAGIVFPVGVYIGMVGSWLIMGAFALGLTVAFFRNISRVSSNKNMAMENRV